MKKFILKQWYPSLGNDFEVGDIVFYDKERGCYAKPNNRDTVLRKREVENSPDFWEKIKQPLFVTEDGVKIFDFRLERCYYVNDKLEKTNSFINWFTVENLAKGIKVFFHESNADEYIWQNKRVFSYEDVVEWYGYGFKLGREGIYETLERLAKERSEQ